MILLYLDTTGSAKSQGCKAHVREAMLLFSTMPQAEIMPMWQSEKATKWTCGSRKQYTSEKNKTSR